MHTCVQAFVLPLTKPCFQDLQDVFVIGLTHQKAPFVCCFFFSPPPFVFVIGLTHQKAPFVCFFFSPPPFVFVIGLTHQKAPFVCCFFFSPPPLSSGECFCDRPYTSRHLLSASSSFPLLLCLFRRMHACLNPYVTLKVPSRALCACVPACAFVPECPAQMDHVPDAAPS